MRAISETQYRQWCEQAIERLPANRETLWHAINLKVSQHLGEPAEALPVMGDPPPEYPYVVHLQQVLHRTARFSFDPLKIASEIVNRVILGSAMKRTHNLGNGQIILTTVTPFERSFLSKVFYIPENPSKDSHTMQSSPTVEAAKEAADNEVQFRNPEHDCEKAGCGDWMKDNFVGTF